MRRGIAAWLLAAALAPAARAATPQAHLLYVREAGAERCPDEAGLREAVARRLGYDPFSERAPITVQVAIGRAARGGLRATIELVDAVGEVTGARELVARGADCAVLASTVELAVSMAVDPLSFAREPGAPPPEENPAERGALSAAPAENRAASTARDGETPWEHDARSKPPADRRAPPDREPEREPVEDNHLRVIGGVGALTALGSAPSITFGFTLSGELARRRWSVGVELRGDLPTSQAGTGGQFSTALYILTFAPCLRVTAFAVCALGALGAQVARGDGYAVSRVAVTPFVGAGIRAAVQLKLHKWVGVQVAADLLGAIVRTALQANSVQVYDTPPVSGALHLALLGYFR